MRSANPNLQNSAADSGMGDGANGRGHLTGPTALVRVLRINLPVSRSQLSAWVIARLGRHQATYCRLASLRRSRLEQTNSRRMRAKPRSPNERSRTIAGHRDGSWIFHRLHRLRFFRCLHYLRQVSISTLARRQESPLYFQVVTALKQSLLSPRLRCVFNGLHVPHSSHDE